MTPRTIVLLLIAVLTVGGTFYVAQDWLDTERGRLDALRKKPKAKAPQVKVLVAKRALPAGTILKSAHLRWQSWPDRGVPSNYIIRGKGKAKIEDVAGSVVRRGIYVGEPITAGRVVKPGQQGFMAAVLTPGMRAITVPVNATSGIAGFIFPGDRVDMILTHTVGKRKRKRRVSETILTGLRVLGVDQKTNDQKGKARVAKTATFEVTPKQAEMIAVAAQIGRLSLSLRSLARTAASGRKGKGGRLVDALESDNRPAARGWTHTWASQVSRVVRSKGRARKVIVVRGKSIRSVVFNNLGQTIEGISALGNVVGVGAGLATANSGGAPAPARAAPPVLADDEDGEVDE